MNDDDFDLPPYGPIPSDVRDRVRQTVQKRIRRPKSQRPLAIAAGVSLLVAGAVVVGATRDDRDQSQTANTPARSDVALQRCWSAVQQAGKVAEFPDRSSWRPALLNTSESWSRVTVLGVTTGDKVFFCEASELTVTISDPNAPPRYAAGSKNAALLVSPNGVIAGVIDPTWPAALVAMPPNASAPFLPREGMFIYETESNITPQRQITVAKIGRDFEYDPAQPPAGTDLPRPAPPAVSIVDQPGPPPDRASREGKALGACLPIANAQRPVPDMDSYQPGAMISNADGQLIMARNAARIGACFFVPVLGGPHRAFFSTGPRLSEIDSDQVVAFYSGPLTRFTLGGTVQGNASRMEIRFGNGTTVHTDVVNGTFALVIPEQVAVGPGNELNDEVNITVRLFAASGGTTFEGPLKFWHPNR